MKIIESILVMENCLEEEGICKIYLSLILFIVMLLLSIENVLVTLLLNLYFA